MLSSVLTMQEEILSSDMCVSVGFPSHIYESGVESLS